MGGRAAREAARGCGGRGRLVRDSASAGPTVAPAPHLYLPAGHGADGGRWQREEHAEPAHVLGVAAAHDHQLPEHDGKLGRKGTDAAARGGEAAVSGQRLADKACER